jgi:uncharacterized membrane protein
MYRSIETADFKAFHAAAWAAKQKGSAIVEWTAADTSVKKQLTINWNDPNAWAQIDAEYCLRFGAARPVRRRAQMRFVDC